MTVQEVLDQINLSDRQLAYTTVLSTLQALQRSGWVRPTKEGRAHRYHVTKTRRDAGTTSLRDFIKRTFGGDTKLLFESLLSDTRLSDADLATLKKMIEDKQGENRS
jgi:predicted transcriptional regulator